MAVLDLVVKGGDVAAGCGVVRCDIGVQAAPDRAATWRAARTNGEAARRAGRRVRRAAAWLEQYPI
jgi:hypothetical protein